MDSARYRYASGLELDASTTAGITNLMYALYPARKIARGGVENSQMTRRPPGFSTRNISVSAAFASPTLRRPKEMVTTSNSLSAKGRAVASASTNSRAGCFRRPTAIIPAEKSSATTSAPDRDRAAELVPVPAAMSRMRSPGFGSIVRTVAMRQIGELPIERMPFVRS